jgi:hypothetical protein
VQCGLGLLRWPPVPCDVWHPLRTARIACANRTGFRSRSLHSRLILKNAPHAGARYRVLSEYRRAAWIPAPGGRESDGRGVRQGRRRRPSGRRPRAPARRVSARAPSGAEPLGRGAQAPWVDVLAERDPCGFVRDRRRHVYCLEPRLVSVPTWPSGHATANRSSAPVGNRPSQGSVWIMNRGGIPAHRILVGGSNPSRQPSRRPGCRNDRCKQRRDRPPAFWLLGLWREASRPADANRA